MRLSLNTEVIFRINPSQYYKFNYIQERLEYLLLIEQIYISLCSSQSRDDWKNQKKQFNFLMEINKHTQPESSPTELTMVFEEYPITSYLNRSHKDMNLFEYELFKRILQLEKSSYQSKLRLASWEHGKQLAVEMIRNFKITQDQLPWSLQSLYDLVLLKVYGGPLNRSHSILLRLTTTEMIFDNFEIAMNRVSNGDAEIHKLINEFECLYIKGILSVLNQSIQFKREIIDHTFSRHSFFYETTLF